MPVGGINSVGGGSFAMTSMVKGMGPVDPAKEAEKASAVKLQAQQQDDKKTKEVQQAAATQSGGIDVMV